MNEAMMVMTAPVEELRRDATKLERLLAAPMETVRRYMTEAWALNARLREAVCKVLEA